MNKNPIRGKCFECRKGIPSPYAKYCRQCSDRLKTKPLKERFFKFIKKSDGCWEWIGARDPRGYGRFHVASGVQLATRMMWKITYGVIDPGKSVCHRCDNPSCCRPEHLFLGTQFDNAFDSTRKGRNNAVRKLTAEQVREIKHLYQSSARSTKRRKNGCGAKFLAKQFGVTKNAIQCILNGETWKHII